MTTSFSASSAAAAPLRLTVELNARLQPMHRGELFEDPLAGILAEHGLGEILGGGTAVSPIGEVERGDIEVALASGDPASIEALTGVLDRLGATRGSRLVFDDGRAPLAFGASEAMAVYLNGTDLPDAVYAECDVNHVYAELDRLVEGQGMVMSYWQGPSETALYLHGRSFEAMREATADFLASYPLCAKARVVQTA